MTCRELADFISDYLAGELRDEVRAPFEHHLSLCPNCVKYLQTFRTTIELSRRAFENDAADPSLSMPEELVNAILAARDAKRGSGDR